MPKPRLVSESDTGQASDEDRLQALREAITLYVGNQRLADAMEREAIAQLEGAQRHFALSKSGIINDIRYCRMNPRQPAALAILHLITRLCDNNEGSCWLSIKRMAQLFGRTERSVRESIDALEKAGVLFVERLDGLPCRYWPAVAPFLARAGVAVGSFVDALSDAPKRPGRPAKTPEQLFRPFSETPGTTVHPFSEKPLNTCAKTPEQLAHSIILKDITAAEDERGSERAGATLEGEILQPVTGAVTTQHLESFNAAFNAWTAATDGERHHGRDITDRKLLDLLSAYTNFPAGAVQIALAETLTIVGEKARSKIRNRESSAFVAYFTKSLRPKLIEAKSTLEAAEAQRAEQTALAQVKLLTEKAVGERRLKAFDDAVAQGTAAREKRLTNGSAQMPSRMSQAFQEIRERAAKSSKYETDENGRRWFNPDAKLRTIAFHSITGSDGNRLLREVDEATVEDVEDVLIEVSGVVEKRKKLNRDGDQVSIKTVIDTATSHLRKRVLYRKFGKLQDQFRGPPAKLDDGWELISDWAAIPKVKLDEWLQKYPKAVPPDSYYTTVTLQGIWVDLLAVRNDWRKYGQGLQDEIETKFEAALAKRHEEAVEKERQLEKWEAERRAWEQDFLEEQAGRGTEQWEQMNDVQRENAVERMRQFQERARGVNWSIQLRAEMQAGGQKDVYQ